MPATRPFNYRLLLLIMAGAALFVGLLFTAHSAAAFPEGMTGLSGNPATGGATCTACHFGGARPSVVLIGPTEVAVGETARYTLRINGGPAQTGGFNVSTTDGTLASISGDVQLLDGELTHTSPKPFSGTSVSFSFNWTAPARPKTVVMYGAGNSTNDNLQSSGDGIGTGSITIRVVAAADEAMGTRPEPTPVPNNNSSCVIPASGPWPPCATGGNVTNNSDECVIPASGPWPPCATGGKMTPSSSDNCVIPASGPWPPCATGGKTAPKVGKGCVIPASGPWPPCATGGGATNSRNN